MDNLQTDSLSSKVIAWVWLVFGSISALTALAVLSTLVFGDATPYIHKPQVQVALESSIQLIIFSTGVYGSIGLLRNKSWARKLMLNLSIALLIVVLCKEAIDFLMSQIIQNPSSAWFPLRTLTVLLMMVLPLAVSIHYLRRPFSKRVESPSGQDRSQNPISGK